MKKSILLLMTISALTLSTNGLKAAAAAKEKQLSIKLSEKAETDEMQKADREAMTNKIEDFAQAVVDSWPPEEIEHGLKICSDIDKLTKQIDGLLRNKLIASAIIDSVVKAGDFSTLKALLYPDTKSPPSFETFPPQLLANWIKQRLDKLYPPIDPKLLEDKKSDLKKRKQALYRSFLTEDYIFCEQVLIRADEIKNPTITE